MNDLNSPLHVTGVQEINKMGVYNEGLSKKAIFCWKELHANRSSVKQEQALCANIFEDKLHGVLILRETSSHINAAIFFCYSVKCKIPSKEFPS